MDCVVLRHVAKEKPQNTLRGWPLAGQSKRHTIRFDHAAPQNDLGLIVSCARSDCHIRRLNSNPGHFGLSRGFRILRCNHIAQVTPSAPPAPTHGTAGQPASTTQTTLATSAAAMAKGVAAAHRYCPWMTFCCCIPRRNTRAKVARVSFTRHPCRQTSPLGLPWRIRCSCTPARNRTASTPTRQTSAPS